MSLRLKCRCCGDPVAAQRRPLTCDKCRKGGRRLSARCERCGKPVVKQRRPHTCEACREKARVDLLVICTVCKARRIAPQRKPPTCDVCRKEVKHQRWLTKRAIAFLFLDAQLAPCSHCGTPFPPHTIRNHRAQRCTNCGQPVGY